MILLVVVFYFILIRPQQQRTKQQAKMLAALKSGDKVITAAGIIGMVVTVKDKTVTLRSADAKFEVTKVFRHRDPSRRSRHPDRLLICHE